jgi:hypothetical protein
MSQKFRSGDLVVTQSGNLRSVICLDHIRQEGRVYRTEDPQAKGWTYHNEAELTLAPQPVIHPRFDTVIDFAPSGLTVSVINLTDRQRIAQFLKQVSPNVEVEGIKVTALVYPNYRLGDVVEAIYDMVTSAIVVPLDTVGGKKFPPKGEYNSERSEEG